MANSRNDPYRTCNRRVSFNLSEFYRRLLGVFGTELPQNPEAVFGLHPSGWYEACCGEWGGRYPAREVDYLLSELLSKYSDGGTSERLRTAALERFTEAEELCRATNERLIANESYRFSFGATASSILYLASQKISSLLGDFSWDAAERGMSWGPGATYSLPRTQADALYKFQGNLETTLGNLALASTVVQRSPLWSHYLGETPFLIVKGNKVTTVPKNAKTDRCIAIEPRMNMFVQKGIGALIRKALRKVGIDLDSQRENRDMARLGSLLDNLSTIDLSMASDTVSLELVRQLLPEPWLLALEQCRSTEGVLPSGESLTYQKFSSMGNGYTFELETLIFWALASAVSSYLELKDRRVAVYGDDILYPSVATPYLIEVLEYCGFLPNTKKTFIEGPFRESCGGHYLEGRDVTPFYIRRPVVDLFEVFLLHNNLYRWFCRNRTRGTWSRPLARGLMLWIRKHAPADWRKPRLPDGYGDGAFIGTFDDCRPVLKRSLRERGFEGFTVQILTNSVKSLSSQSGFLMVKSLFSMDRRQRHRLDFLDGVNDSEVLPQRVGRARITTILVPQFALLDPFQEFPLTRGGTPVN